MLTSGFGHRVRKTCSKTCPNFDFGFKQRPGLKPYREAEDVNGARVLKAGIWGLQGLGLRVWGGLGP